MALLPEDTRSQKRVLGILLLVGTGVGFYVHVYAPGERELAAARLRAEELAARSELSRLHAGEVGRSRADLERQEQLLAALQELVPDRTETAKIYEQVATRADTLGLELVGVAPSGELPTEGGSYRRLRWELTVEGEYHALGAFITRMASLRRIVRPGVRSIESLGRTGDGRTPVRASLALETLVLGAGAARLRGVRPGHAPDDTVLHQREVFVYSAGDRSDPFRPSVPGSTADRHRDDLRLLGIVYAPGGESVAVLRDASTGRLHRVREGEVIDRVRVVSIGPSEVVFGVGGRTGTRRELLGPARRREHGR